MGLLFFRATGSFGKNIAMYAKNTIGVLLSSIVLTTVACSKKDHPNLPQLPTPHTDKQTVQLKEIVSQDEPSPHFAFTYDDSSYVSTASFAGNFVTYHYFYKNQRIDSVSTLLQDGTYLLYRYEGQQVTRVEQYGHTGLAQIISISYDRRNRVTSMEWKPVTSGDGKTVTFDYYGDGNLHAMKSFYPASGLTALVTYEAYDDKKNVDGFAVFKDFFDHLILLPGVKFQYNNATKVSMLRGANKLDVQHEYTYNNDLPVQQKTTMHITDGTGKSQTLTGLTTYSYYNAQ